MNNGLYRQYLAARTAAGLPTHSARRLYEIERDGYRGAIDIQAADDGTAEIRIYEDIGLDWWTGEGMTVGRMAELLDQVSSPQIRVRINSPGGSVFDGIAIYNLLRERQEHVTVTIDGIAASAASVVAMAGDTIEAAQNAQLMIHSAWTVAVGNASDMRETAEILERIDGQLADTYAARSGMSRADVTDLMATDSYLTASEAKDMGLVDQVLELKGAEPQSRKDKGIAVLNMQMQRVAMARAALARARIS